MLKLDKIDMRILRALQANGNQSTTEIAEQVGISQSPCSRRILALQEKGVIKGKTVDLDRRKLGFDVQVVARVRLNKHDRKALEAFKQKIQMIPEIQYAVLLLGGFDYHLHIVVKDIDHYQSLVQNQLVSLPAVQEMESSVILDVVKKTTALPI